MFQDQRSRKRPGGNKKQNYSCFKRMIAVKPAVYDNHLTMLRLYEIYCSDASLPTYWGDDGDTDSELDIAEPDEVSEIDCDDGF